MKKLKRLATLTLAMVLVLAMAACGGGSSSTAPSTAGATSTAGAEPAAASGPEINICIVTSSGVDDGSFGQDCYNGILAYVETNPNAKVNTIKESDIGKVVDAAAQVIADYDVLVLPGFQFAPIGAVAVDNPDTKIILVDAAPSDKDGAETELDNVYSMQFREQESGFYAGIAAAMQTETGKVAVVNGIAYPSNVNYQYGFMSGVNYANKYFDTTAEIVELPSYAGEDVTGANVGGNYIGAFADQATGKVVGETLIAQGVDIMFVAAGDSGNGVFAAAKEADGVYVIGCDVDQYDDGVNGSENIVLTSGLKVMNINVTRQLEAIANGTFEGKNDVLGADTDSTGYVSAEGRQQLSEDTLAKLAEVQEKLKSGEIVPAANFNEMTPDNFTGL